MLKCVVPSAADPSPRSRPGTAFIPSSAVQLLSALGNRPVAKAADLQDEQRFFADLAAGTLPAVSFIKPVGIDNEHPNYASSCADKLHIRGPVAALCKSKYWQNTAVFITYDENGGRWDHVTPPKIDQWGPGTRVAVIVVSPYARAALRRSHAVRDRLDPLVHREAVRLAGARTRATAQANPFEVPSTTRKLRSLPIVEFAAILAAPWLARFLPDRSERRRVLGQLGSTFPFLPAIAEVHSAGGALDVALRAALDAGGRPAFFWQGRRPRRRCACGRAMSIRFHYRNDLPEICGLGMVSDSNLHFHGLTTAPRSPGDDAISIVVAAGP